MRVLLSIAHVVYGLLLKLHILLIILLLVLTVVVLLVLLLIVVIVIVVAHLYEINLIIL